MINVNNDGTVTYPTTGLMWKRCAEGQTWTGSTCTGNATVYTWEEAVALTSNFAGYDDWRIPTEEELLSLVDQTVCNPAIDKTVFPNTPSSAFWSASADAGDSDYAWYVHFYDGYAGYYDKDDPFQVRMCRRVE